MPANTIGHAKGMTAGLLFSEIKRMPAVRVPACRLWPRLIETGRKRDLVRKGVVAPPGYLIRTVAVVVAVLSP
jgi:hypothetical protein